MDDFRNLIDRILEDAANQGRFANLPGEGKPLRLEDDHLTPAHLRMAHKLLRDNDLTPEWITEGADLETLRDALLKRLGRAAAAYAAGSGPTPEVSWTRVVRRFEDAAREYNRKLLSYNLKVPPGVHQRPYMDSEREVRRALERTRGGS